MISGVPRCRTSAVKHPEKVSNYVNAVNSVHDQSNQCHRGEEVCFVLGQLSLSSNQFEQQRDCQGKKRNPRLEGRFETKELRENLES